MKFVLIALSLLFGQFALAQSAFEIKCETDSLVLYVDNYAVLPNTHGGSGTILNQFRIFDPAVANTVAREDFTSVDAGFDGTAGYQIVVEGPSGRVSAVVPGLTERQNGTFHQGYADIEVNVGGYELSYKQQPCSIFLN